MEIGSGLSIATAEVAQKLTQQVFWGHQGGCSTLPLLNEVRSYSRSNDQRCLYQSAVTDELWAATMQRLVGDKWETLGSGTEVHGPGYHSKPLKTNGAKGGTRTPTPSRAPDPKSGASAKFRHFRTRRISIVKRFVHFAHCVSPVRWSFALNSILNDAPQRAPDVLFCPCPASPRGLTEPEAPARAEQWPRPRARGSVWSLTSRLQIPRT